MRELSDLEVESVFGGLSPAPYPPPQIGRQYLPGELPGEQPPMPPPERTPDLGVPDL